MGSWIVIIGVFAVTAVVVIVVGFIGNKAVDGAENAMRRRRYERSGGRPNESRPESLAMRYAQTASSNNTANIRGSAICRRCGAALKKDAVFCGSCGTMRGSPAEQATATCTISDHDMPNFKV